MLSDIVIPIFGETDTSRFFEKFEHFIYYSDIKYISFFFTQFSKFFSISKFFMYEFVFVYACSCVCYSKAGVF